MSTIFIAVQCYQCSTMQVKQQKKSSNKWTCVVCNQKQSVRKVFSLGFMAKEVRKFVQGFNMSRQSEDTQIEIEESTTEENDPPPPSEFGSSSSYQRRRNDWTEYLDTKDNEPDDELNGVSGAVSEPEITTEFPRELYQKPKLKNSAELHKTHGNKLFKPIFPKRKEKPIPKRKENTEVRTMAKGASKWSDYLEGDIEEVFEIESDSPSPCGSWWNKNQINDERVAEDIHPDFM